MPKILLYTLALLLIIGGATSVYAITVAPAKIEITVDPGGQIVGEIELFNEQEEAKTFYVSYENFESRGDSGAPYFTGSKDGLATWITTGSEFTVSPGERMQVPYTVSVPLDAKPGGYFSAVFFGSQPPQADGGGEVTIGGKIGVLMLLRVAGDIEESAGVVDFSTLDNQRFFSTLPVTLGYSFNNTGGDRVVPRGEIIIKNTLQLKSATLTVNDNEGSVLPNSTRRFEVSWGEKKIEQGEEEKRGFFETVLAQVKDFHFGWYSAHMQVSWGESAQSADVSYSFFIIPWQLLTIVLVIVGFMTLVFKVWMGKFRRKILSEAMSNR